MSAALFACRGRDFRAGSDSSSAGSTDDWRGDAPGVRQHIRPSDLPAADWTKDLAVSQDDAFPAEYRGDAFVTLNGSHSRPQMTGFAVDSARVRGRPAGVAVTRDGALFVSDDANGTIFRIARR